MSKVVDGIIKDLKNIPESLRKKMKGTDKNNLTVIVVMSKVVESFPLGQTQIKFHHHISSRIRVLSEQSLIDCTLNKSDVAMSIGTTLFKRFLSKANHVVKNKHIACDIALTLVLDEGG